MFRGGGHVAIRMHSQREELRDTVSSVLILMLESKKHPLEASCMLPKARTNAVCNSFPATAEKNIVVQLSRFKKMKL